MGGSQSLDAGGPDSPPNHQPAASNKRAREAEPEEAGPSGEAHEYAPLTACFLKYSECERLLESTHTCLETVLATAEVPLFAREHRSFMVHLHFVKDEGLLVFLRSIEQCCVTQMYTITAIGCNILSAGHRRHQSSWAVCLPTSKRRPC